MAERSDPENEQCHQYCEDGESRNRSLSGGHRWRSPVIGYNDRRRFVADTHLIFPYCHQPHGEPGGSRLTRRNRNFAVPDDLAEEDGSDIVTLGRRAGVFHNHGNADWVASGDVRPIHSDLGHDNRPIPVENLRFGRSGRYWTRGG